MSVQGTYTDLNVGDMDPPNGPYQAFKSPHNNPDESEPTSYANTNFMHDEEEESPPNESESQREERILRELNKLITDLSNGSENNGTVYEVPEPMHESFYANMEQESHAL